MLRSKENLPLKGPPYPKPPKNLQKTYNSGDSLVVTHLTTNPPVHCLSTAERTGSSVFSVLWSYVEVIVAVYVHILLYVHHKIDIDTRSDMCAILGFGLAMRLEASWEGVISGYLTMLVDERIEMGVYLLRYISESTHGQSLKWHDPDTR
jgi:hypothetical protein